MNKRNKNLPVLLALVFLLISSFGGLGYYVYQKRVNEKNQEIMINEIKNSVMDRNYKKAHSITKMLKDKYPKNQDIAMLEGTLSELASNNPFESKDSQRDTANQILDKIQGNEASPNIDSELAFNNRFIEDNVITENYSDRTEDTGISKADIAEFEKSRTPEKLSPRDEEIKELPDNNSELNTNKNLFNLERLKSNLNKEIENESLKHKNVVPEVAKAEPKEEIVTEPPKATVTTAKPAPATLPKPIEIAQVSPAPRVAARPANRNNILGKIEWPYSYLVKKELYEILDDINTGRPLVAKKRLDDMVSKGLSIKFKQVNDLIDASKNKEAARLLLTLIKRDIEPNLVGISKAPSKEELLKNAAEEEELRKQREAELKKRQDDALKSKITSIKESDLDDSIKRDQAITDLKDYLKKFPTDLNALRMLALAYEKKPDLVKAEGIYARIANITNWAADYYKLGVIRFKMRRYEPSIQAFNKTIEIDPKHKKAFNNKGIDLIMLNKNQEAISEFDKAIRIDPNYDVAYYQKGIAYERSNNLNNAFANFVQAHKISQKPNYALKAGIVANHINDFANGEKYLGMAYPVMGNNDIMLYNFAKAKFENNKLNEALDMANKALALKPNKEDYLYLKASINLKNKNYNESIYLYNAVIAKNPNNISAYINKANAYENMNNVSTAISTLEEITSKNNTLALNNLGILYRKQKNYQKAIEIFTLSSNTGNLDGKYNLAVTYIEAGDSKKAAELLNEYVRLNPNNPDALYFLGVIEYNENKNDTVLRNLLEKFPNYRKNNEIRKILGT